MRLPWLIGDMEPFPNFLEHLLESQRPNADAMRWRDIIDAARNSCESRDAPWFLGRCDVNRRQFLETPVHPEGRAVQRSPGSAKCRALTAADA